MITTRLYLSTYILLFILILSTRAAMGVEISEMKRGARLVDIPYVTHLVDLTYLQSAVKKGAVCLDGSPPAYQFDKGVGDGVHNWIVFLEGGGWCDTSQDCLNRSRWANGLGSSNYMFPKNFTGMLANEQQLNPYFYNWNRVYVRYCDGASFTGNKRDLAYKLHYKGAKIFDAIMKDLLAKGMQNASNALLAGCSAGGLATILNCDKFRSLLPTSTKVKCASDAGYFLHVKDVFGGYNFAKFYHNVVKLHGSAKNLPLSCTSKMKPESLCFYPQYVVPLIRTPLFIINSAYDTYQITAILAPSLPNLPKSWERCKNDTQTCSSNQVKTLKDFRFEFLHALPTLSNGSFRGMFIDSCLIHCQYHLQSYWNGDPSLRLYNKTISEALGGWYYGRSAFQKIDYKNDLPKVCLSNPW